MSNLVMGHSGLAARLVEAVGLDPTYCRRIVLDVEVGNLVKVYVELVVERDKFEALIVTLENEKPAGPDVVICEGRAEDRLDVAMLGGVDVGFVKNERAE